MSMDSDEDVSFDADPDTAAEFALGGDVQMDSGRGVSFGEPGVASPASRLFDGDAPGPSIPELEREYGISEKYITMPLRGILRVSTGSGVPPIVEILLGGVLFGLKRKELQKEDMDSALDAMNNPDRNTEGTDDIFSEYE